MTEKNYNSLVLFEAPLFLDECWIYGLIFNKQQILDIIEGRMTLDENIQRYIEYIVGCAEWLASGNGISDDKHFFIKGNDYHYFIDYNITKFCSKVYKKCPLHYQIILDCNPTYCKEDNDDGFIISAEAYNKWKEEYGKN